jgi:hypothetical protein
VQVTKRAVLAGLGGLLTLMGIVWTLQGLGVLGGSAMSDETLWAVIGPLVALVGVGIAVAALRGRGSQL